MLGEGDEDDEGDNDRKHGRLLFRDSIVHRYVGTKSMHSPRTVCKKHAHLMHFLNMKVNAF